MSSEGRFIADVLIGISGTLWIYKRNYSFTQLLLPHVQWILTNNKWGRSFCFAGKSECACSSVKQTESDVVLGEQSGVWQFYRRFSVFMLDFSARTCRLAFLPAAGKWCSWAVFADYLKNIHRLCESLEMLEIYRHCYKRLRRWQLRPKCCLRTFSVFNTQTMVFLASCLCWSSVWYGGVMAVQAGARQRMSTCGEDLWCSPAHLQGNLRFCLPENTCRVVNGQETQQNPLLRCTSK